MPFKNKVTIDYSNTSNSNFLRLCLLLYPKSDEGEVSSEFEELSDVGSPRVIVYGYNGLPMMLQDPYAYVKAAMQEPPLPDYVPEPAYPEFMPPEDDVFPAEEQPLPAAVSPTADSPSYITESDPEEDPEEEDDEDPEEDPANYPTDRDDEEEEESSRDDAND
ncbi:hypothetical protein Tco_0005971 [Tanacetum coccineum]